MGAAGRTDVDLIVSAGGMLSRKHHPNHTFENDPLKHAAQTPPILIVHSKNDKQASYSGAKAFYKKASAAGVDAVFVSTAGTHFETIFEANKELKKYLNANLGD